MWVVGRCVDYFLETGKLAHLLHPLHRVRQLAAFALFYRGLLLHAPKPATAIHAVFAGPQ